MLVTLSDGAEVAGLNEAGAAYREAQKLFERQQSLAQRQLIAASQFDLQRAARARELFNGFGGVMSFELKGGVDEWKAAGYSMIGA